MRIAHDFRILALLVLGALVAGCANQANQNPPPPPLLGLAASRCAAAPNLADARTLVYAPKKAKNNATAEITGASPCFKDAVGASLYVAYKLPFSPTSYVVRVTSEPEGDTLLALRVLLYGSNGTLKREFSGKQIVFRGGALSVIFRSHDDERCLVVASDPAVVGHRDSRVHETTRASMVAMVNAVLMLYTGMDVVAKDVYADNGRVIVSLGRLAAK